MRIFIICSKSFYEYIPQITNELVLKGITTIDEIILPNCYDAPETESKYRNTKEHSKWKGKMIKHSETVISGVDAVLVLNYDKNGVKNYIGGATFLEMYDAFRLGKQIYLINDIPEGMLKDEIIGFNPLILNGDIGIIGSKSLTID
jgi:hypothetical protein